VCQHESFFLFDELLTSPLIHSSSIQTKNCIEQQPLNSSLLFIITCLLLLVHLPYILLSFFHMFSLQLSTFIYIHWFGTLFIPMIHIK
jgi:flagellar biosynthesis component FlhA